MKNINTPWIEKVVTSTTSCWYRNDSTSLFLHIFYQCDRLSIINQSIHVLFLLLNLPRLSLTEEPVPYHCNSRVITLLLDGVFLTSFLVSLDAHVSDTESGKHDDIGFVVSTYLTFISRK